MTYFLKHCSKQQILILINIKLKCLEVSVQHSRNYSVATVLLTFVEISNVVESCCRVFFLVLHYLNSFIQFSYNNTENFKNSSIFDDDSTELLQSGSVGGIVSKVSLAISLFLLVNIVRVLNKAFSCSS